MNENYRFNDFVIMKELTIEEKATRYDESIERANKVLLDCTIEERNVVEFLLPELKESEDERIRKEIVRFIQMEVEDEIVGNKWIAWLEKQDEKFQYWKASKEQLEALDYAYNLCPDTENGNYYEGVLETLINDLHKLSERQGEQKATNNQFTPEQESILDKHIDRLAAQKPTDKVEPKFKVGDKIKLAKEPKYPAREIIAIKNDAYYFDGLVNLPFSEQDSWELVEKKTVREAESKFKEGDWVIDKQGITHQIANVVETVPIHTYGYDIVGGGYFNDNTEGVRLWTIRDAKDGDIIQLSDITAIFKSCIYDWGCKCHCTVYKGKFKTASEEYENYETYGTYNAKPATKEQRDLLFQKMKEAGYEWDAENKELTKIERNPVTDTLENSHNMTKEKFLHDINAGRYPKYILSQIKEGKPEKECSSIVCTSSNSIVLAKYENGKWYQAHFTSAPSQSIYYTSINEDVIYWTDGAAEDRTREQFDNNE